MPKLIVHRTDDGNAGSTEKAEKAREAVRWRAYELFGKRGDGPGGEPDDWLQTRSDMEAMACWQELPVGAWRGKETVQAESRVLQHRFELASPQEIEPVAARAAAA